jgi:hypothetical protein
MSYSRWISSSWYTFWNSSSSDLKNKQSMNIMFSIDEGCNIFFGEIVKKGFDAIMSEMKEIFYRASEDELNELSFYIHNFYEDVLNDKETV